MRTTIIFGSGVTYYSDIPGIKKITKEILSLEKIANENHTNFDFKNYLGFKKNPFNKNNIKKNQKLILLIKKDIDEFFKHIKLYKDTNYEDIYYVLKQIEDSYSHESENPATYKLIQHLIKTLEVEKGSFKDLINNTTEYIRHTVWQSLDKDIYKYDQFNIINELQNAYQLNTIINLNHDLVLEKWLNKQNIDFDDGFGSNRNELQEWKGFNNDKSKIKICNLHGNINWFPFRIKSSNSDNLVKIPINFQTRELFIMNQSPMSPTEKMPHFLIGTFNKMRKYLYSIPELLWVEYKNSIFNSELIIISGYGFGDQGVNSKLNRWLYKTDAKRMVIIHPDKKKLLNNARGSFLINIMNQRSKHEKVKFLEKKFEDVNINEILKIT